MSVTPVSTVFVLRHAHASWALPGQTDHQRVLDERGRAEAVAIGAEIGRQGYRIERVVVSDAARTLQTLAAIVDHLGPDVVVETTDDLYSGGVDAYFAAVTGAAQAGSVMLVGHNPMIEEFALALCGAGDPDTLARLQSGFPTAGLAVVDFSVPLAEAAPGLGRLRSLIDPREL